MIWGILMSAGALALAVVLDLVRGAEAVFEESSFVLRYTLVSTRLTFRISGPLSSRIG